MSLPTMQGDLCIAMRVEVCTCGRAAYACVVYSISYFSLIPIYRSLRTAYWMASLQSWLIGILY